MEPGISPYSNGSACLPNLPKTTAISPTPPLCCTTYASPYLDSLSGSLRRFRPQGFFFIHFIHALLGAVLSNVADCI